MLQSISKKKIYFYLLIFLLFSSIFNFNISSKFKKLNLISHINIFGLSEKETKILEKNLEYLINKNIFLINRKEIEEKLNINSFLDNYNIVKVFPSKLLVNVKKTEFVAKVIYEGEKFYIGKNGKLTKVSLVEQEYNLPQVFGNLEINEFLKLQKTLNDFEFNISKIKNYYYYKSNRWDIEYKDKTVVMLPSYDLENSLKNYKSFIKVEKNLPGQTIDLRIKNKIILSNAKR